MSIKELALALREELLSAVRSVEADAEDVLAEIEEHVGGVLSVIRNEVAFIVTGEKGGEYVAPAQPTADLDALKKQVDDLTAAAEASKEQIATLEAQNAALTAELAAARSATQSAPEAPTEQATESSEATPPASQTSDEQAGEAPTPEPAQG